jgi:hypothetical protein
MIAIAMLAPPLRSGDPPARREAEPELDRATLLLCRARDKAAFRAFVVHYQRAVFACLSRMLGRGPHVDDLAQEVFLRAYRAMPAFDVERRPAIRVAPHDRDPGGARPAEAARHTPAADRGGRRSGARGHAGNVVFAR